MLSESRISADLSDFADFKMRNNQSFVIGGLAFFPHYPSSVGASWARDTIAYNKPFLATQSSVGASWARDFNNCFTITRFHGILKLSPF